MLVRKLDAARYARAKHWRVYAPEGLAHCRVAVWLGEGEMAVEYGGQALSRYDVSFSSGEARLEEVANPRLFATGYRPPQLKLFGLEDVLGEVGWLAEDPQGRRLRRPIPEKSRGPPEAVVPLPRGLGVTSSP